MESKYVRGFMRGRDKRRFVHSFINPLTSSPLAVPCPLPVRLSELLSYRLWQLTLTCQTTTTLLTGSIWPLSESTLLFPLSLPSVFPRPLYFPYPLSLLSAPPLSVLSLSLCHTHLKAFNYTLINRDNLPIVYYDILSNHVLQLPYNSLFVFIIASVSSRPTDID
jgi:hypothetical protein